MVQKRYLDALLRQNKEKLCSYSMGRGCEEKGEKNRQQLEWLPGNIGACQKTWEGRMVKKRRGAKYLGDAFRIQNGRSVLGCGKRKKKKKGRAMKKEK